MEQTHVMPDGTVMPGATHQETVLQREAPEAAESRKAFVREWQQRVKRAKERFKPDFKRMRACMEYVEYGGPEKVNGLPANERYVANIIQRFVNQKVAALYAKNPRVQAKRRNRLEYRIWDGQQASIDEAMMELQAFQQAMAAAPPIIDMATGMPVPPPVPPGVTRAQALLQDIDEAKQRRRMLDRVGKTAEALFDYFMNEADPPFKVQAKGLVRRTVTTGVGYVKLGFQRVMEDNPEVVRRLNDSVARLKHLETLTADIADGVITEEHYQVEELQRMVADLTAQKQMVVREGLTFEFPRATEIIVDPECRSLRAFQGAQWIAHEFMMTADQIKQTYSVDVGQGFQPYRDDKDAVVVRPEIGGVAADAKACVWEVYDKRSGLVFTLCDGYADYLKEPAAPDVWVEGFWPIFALVFNDIESETRLYPLSDVEVILPMQEEYNMARQGLREHRARNRPGWVTGVELEDTDKVALQNNEVNAVVQLKALAAQGRAVSDVIQAKPTAPIDPNLYEVNPVFQDIQRTGGMMEANLGGTGGDTATEASIGEQSRVTALGSNIDDLDEFLTALARAAGQIMIAEMSPEMVAEIAGPGAVWPDSNRQQIAEELFLAIQAGSSGRPNKAQELANIERVAPYIVQTPALNPQWWLRKLVETVFDGADVDEAIADGLPSITALNAMMGRAVAQPQAPGGDPNTDPAQQGGQGATNAPNPQERPPGPQPAYPAGA